MHTTEIIDKVFTLFAKRGDRHYGENVTEQEHALQSATFAERAGEPAHVVAACLVHDIGHLLHDLGEDVADHGIDAHHEEKGAVVLNQWFVPEVVEPARLHVAAKRYLCWKHPEYLAGLSEASAKSLALQGGPMTDAEGAEFESLPHFDSAVRLRHYDDMGKVEKMETPTLEYFRPVLERFVKGNRT